MKKTILFLLFLLSLAFSCKDDTSDVNPVYDEIPLEEEIQLSSDLKVKVDARIELLAVVQSFTDWADQRHTKYESRYKADVQKYFKNFSDHPAIKKSQELVNKGFSYDAPPALVLYHGGLPEFEQILPYSDYLVNRAGSKGELEDFAKKLRDFAKVTNFNAFLESEKSFFIKIENDIKRVINDRDYIQILEDYYGMHNHSYNVVPSPLFHAGGYGPSVNTPEGKDIYDICGPQSSTKGLPGFGDYQYFQSILLHEFSHSFVNFQTENNINRVNNCEKLFEPIESKMKNMAYGTWSTCLNEHLVRTNVARMFNLLEGAGKREDILKKEYDKGFIFIYGLDSLMQIYESDRVLYPSYENFYPEILNYIETISK